ncbi:tripartite tricarboxylate transporter TctB family protein [Jiangella asiatica]|uniref:Tripartite tricarboxylate transporter TctB family protein n=1 Tax=Jiangella asiatica TaxID=2530372 RepID=A0A4R5DRR4_9ACTN|nr:tripartite tricarboxylate transporter TctB family protein [Jiangella asiatica]TDE14930.1 tripartite tricarboxylate transporter TctB family protein [Jiangella asiatica]
MTLDRGQRYAGVVAIVGGALSIGYSMIALSLGALSQPGSGLWPLIVSVGLLVAGVVLVVRRPRDADTGDDSDTVVEEAGPSGRFVVIAVAVLVAYVIVLQQFGFVVAAALGTIAWLRWFGRESWVSSAVIGLVAAVCLHFLFVEVLHVPLP